MKKFIACTVGLRARHPLLDRPVLTRVCVYDIGEGRAMLIAESGHNASPIPVPTRTIKRSTFSDRPWSATNDIVEAEWALNELGFTIA